VLRWGSHWCRFCWGSHWCQLVVEVAAARWMREEGGEISWKCRGRESVMGVGGLRTRGEAKAGLILIFGFRLVEGSRVLKWRVPLFIFPYTRVSLYI
jgi:hypothetical protein